MRLGRQGKASSKSSKSTKTKARGRDDFLASTIQKLRDMAGNVCSFPECSVHTHGAKASFDGPFSVGVACHIKAASAGGPRYDADQSIESRRDVSNGIWMCQTHSKLIDADESPYSAETLLQWKRLAELRANRMVNKRAFTEQ